MNCCYTLKVKNILFVDRNSFTCPTYIRCEPEAWGLEKYNKINYLIHSVVLSLSKYSPLEFIHRDHRLSHCWNKLWNSRFMILSIIACDSACIFPRYRRIWAITINPSLTSVFDLRKEIFVLFGVISQALNSERRFCFLSLFGTRGTNFAAVRFMFKFSVKMGRHVSHYKHRILQTSLIVRCLPV